MFAAASAKQISLPIPIIYVKEILHEKIFPLGLYMFVVTIWNLAKPMIIKDLVSQMVNSSSNFWNVFAGF